MSTLVVAHRGDSLAARENTPEAFASAVAAGADVVEIDIRTLCDGTSVVLHDDTLLRLWGTPDRVEDANGAPTRPDWVLGSTQSLGHGQCRIPTLRETLEQFTELNTRRAEPVVLLIDTVSVDDVRVAVAAVKSFRTANDQRLLPIRWCGDVAAMLLVRREMPDAVVCLNHPGGALDPLLLQQMRPQIINVEWTQVSEQLVDQVHRLGLDLAVWTVNDAETMAWLVRLGVDAITTDRPRLLAQVVRGPNSPLALAWLQTDRFAAEGGLRRETAETITVARDLAVWANGFTASSTPGPIRTKAHAADLVTDVNLAVERHVSSVIAERLGPDHLVVGEELGGEGEAGRPVWYLDPVDGTTNLANGLPWTSMSLAMAVDNEPVVASVAQPAMGNVFLAARGLGAVLDGMPLHLPRAETLSGRTVLVELDSHAMWPGMPAFLDGLAEQHCTPRVMGSGTLALTGISAGWAAAGVVHSFNPIDHLAGILIAHEAGAEVLNEDGRATLVPILGRPVLVAAPGLGQRFVALWRAARQTCA